jgi:dTDP-4-amino-4,6-dideoxy-D-galactose acyltransferase
MNVPASAPCRLLTWDTDFFRLRVARVQGDVLREEQVLRIDRWSLRNRIRCLYFLARSDDPATVRVAEEHGFRLVDVRVTLEGKPKVSGQWEGPDATGAAAIREARTTDLPGLQELARTAHSDTRFFSDPLFPRERAEALYSTWIALECQGRAQRVLVSASPADKPSGYVSCHLNADRLEAQIGLVAVHKSVRRSGVGKSLVRAALNWLAGQGAKTVSVVTQGRNSSALRLYERCGFLTRELQLWYHKWYPAPNTSDD